MKKFVLVPEDLYKSLISKPTTIDDFSEHLLNDSLKNEKESNTQRHAKYNQRLPGYLEYKKRKRNKPTHVVVENLDQLSKELQEDEHGMYQQQRQQKRHLRVPSLEYLTARGDSRHEPLKRTDLTEDEEDSHSDFSENDTFTVSPNVRFYPESVRRTAKHGITEESESDTDEESQDAHEQAHGTPAVLHTTRKNFLPVKTPIRAKEDAQPRALGFRDEVTEKPESMTRDEAYKMLRTMVMKNKDAFRITRDGKVMSFSNVPVQGSHFDNILQKYRDKSLESVNGERAFRDILLKNPATAEVAKQFFTRSPTILRSGKTLPRQTGEGSIVRRPHTVHGKNSDKSRFTIRDWRKL